MSTQDIVGRLTGALTAQDDITLAFLFGSFVEGSAGTSSDLDIAVYFAGAVDIFRVNELREELTEQTGVEADIVVLNGASPIIRMQVLKKGKLLVDRDHKAYNAFFTRTVNEYDDLKRIRREAEDKILKGRIYA